ncbi:hypothetical protein M5K25_026953 [Dendrobium thyrsiflorum]|uniref:Bifunctional inhibitor/plant lipid transfer protein/seed storage helical domain-containing protein n=1 Tax=Dendrobium thyrsiflorum TaxID=117978 RepID=A0ABD0TYP0_DENTH
MMKTNFILLCLVSALLLSYAPTAMPLTCSLSQLSSCADAFANGTPPSSACCNNIRNALPCFCQYRNNPTLSGYINSPNGKKLIANCKVSLPSC